MIALDHRRRFWISRAMILLVYIPLFNFTFFCLGLINIGLLTEDRLYGLGVMIWGGVAVSLALAKIYEAVVPMEPESIPAFLMQYFVCVSLAAWMCLELINLTSWQLWIFAREEPPVPLVPLMIAYIQIMLFAALKFIRQQDKRHLVLQSNYKEAKFQALKAQLNPHMLFNSLNLISSEIEYNPANASRLLDELSELLRGVLNSANRLMVPLEKELELTRHYLYIQKMRFEERLCYTLDVADDCLQLPVPTLLLQPFVENSIVHGFSRKADTGRILVNISQAEGWLKVQILDNGVGFDPGAAQSGTWPAHRPRYPGADLRRQLQPGH